MPQNLQIGDATPVPLRWLLGGLVAILGVLVTISLMFLEKNEELLDARFQAQDLQRKAEATELMSELKSFAAIVESQRETMRAVISRVEALEAQQVQFGAWFRVYGDASNALKEWREAFDEEKAKLKRKRRTEP